MTVWTPPFCEHGKILLGCPHDDCAAQNAYLAEQAAAYERFVAGQRAEFARYVRGWRPPAGG